MTLFRLVALGIGTALALGVFVLMDLAPQRPDRDVRIAASCHAEYKDNPILVAACVQALNEKYAEEAARAKAQRAYDNSR